ncbi:MULTISPECIES: ATP-binding cassette domain-containing protein [unclassified Corynebacterium]|uniref:ATP-binding cassette domain-containing protein n=1 Tax=unclassified Corynebacterium TaxID=2624378 RepID=UPI00264DF266|nr:MULTISPECIES: ATP-binding cassette domain-containing protein [unclassified Corynebacterium]MDN8594067.1 ATP-binding cassette domain-containing protein [Corynebacterium sp. P4_F2]WKK56737.1 ATP-binding cassette domain-containing protein [Corynebacterium sp. P4-C1]WKK64362.1 ATP-binding cassette domain-containing protein [Corynebacterium sp. P8-C1]
MNSHLACKDVSVAFGDHRVLDGVSLTTVPGRVHALLGPNGAGKSTLMSVLLGLVEPDSGAVTLMGQPFERSRLRFVGASINDPAFYGHLSARDNLRVHTTLLGLPDSEADRVIELVGLGTAGKKKASNFSTGMKGRLALAQALLGEPPVLVLDEPQNGLDPEGIAHLRGYLRDYARAGRTVLVSSHQLGEVLHLADDATVIADGTVRFAGELRELGPNLEESFFQLTRGTAAAGEVR